MSNNDWESPESEYFVNEILANMFIVWVVFYNDLRIKPGKSFARFTNKYGERMFTDKVAHKLDQLQAAYLFTYGYQTVKKITAELLEARKTQKNFKYLEEYLNCLFATPNK